MLSKISSVSLCFCRTMKLLTHNMLTSNIIKGVTNGYPLKIESSNTSVTTVDFNPDFIARMIPKLEWGALKSAADQVGHGDVCPGEVVENYEKDEEFLKKVHHILMQIEVKEGSLICPESGRKFPITNGIPNMLLNEDEI